MFYQVLLTVLGLCIAFEIKCPEPAQWSLRARLHCPNPSLYYCLLSIDGNTRINLENCSYVDLEAPGRRIVIRFNIDSLPCSDDKFQPIKYWTNVSSDCLFLTSKCTEEGQVLYSVDRYHEYDITCRCDHTRGYDFVTRPKNQCFCIPSQEDCSCYKKTCSTVNSDYKCIDETQKSVMEVCTVPNITSDGISKVVLTLLPKINQTDQGNKGNSAKTPTVVAVLVVTIIFICSCVVYLRCRKGCCLVYLRCRKEYFVKTLDPQIRIEGDDYLLQFEVLTDCMDASWFKDDIAIKPSTDKYEVNHNGKKHSLKLLNLNLEDTGEYSIRIKNCIRRAQLTVQEYFVKTLDPQMCIEGDDYLLKCEVLNDCMDASWFKDDIAIKPSTDKYEVNHNGKKHSLKLLNLNLEDTGEYSIRIKNCIRRAQLTVQEYFVKTLDPQMCIEGDDYLLQCEVLNDSMDASWFKDDIAIKPSTDKYEVNHNGKKHSLKLLNLNLEDTGEYSIRIKNCIRRAQLTVQEYFVKTLDPQMCIEGDDYLLQCEVLNDSMDASWFMDDIAIKPSTDKYEVNHNGKKHSLKLLNLNLEDTGEYSIRIKNCIRRAQLTVQELPKTVKAMSNEDIQQFMELAKSEKMERRSFFRTVIVGKEGGGKTYLKRRLLKEQIKDIKKNMHNSTVGVDVDIHNIRIPIADDEDWIFDEDKTIETGHIIAEALDKSVVEGKNTEAENITATLDKSMTQNNTSSPEHLNRRSYKEDIDKLTTVNERQNKVSNEVKHHHDDHQSTKHYGKVQGTLENNKTEKQIKMDGQPHIEQTSMKEIKQVSKENEKNNDEMKYPNEVYNQHKEPKNDIELRMSEINLPLQLSKYAFSKLWDFAGQKIYYATHQVFLTSAAIYLLVVNLQDYSKEKKKNYDEKKEDNFIDIEDYIDFWLDSIYCYSSLDTAGQNLSDKDGTSAELPRVLIICTHTDECKKDDLEALKKEFDTKLGVIHEKKVNATHMDRNIIYISNTQDEDRVFKEIRGRITKLAQHAKENIPLNWILLEMEIDKLGDKKSISVDEIYNLGHSVQMCDKNKIKLFLKYQHKIGNVIFFDEKDLNENVILQPSWLIEVSKCVISHGLSGLQGEHFTNLKDKGIITKKKLEELLKAKYDSDDIDHATKVLQKFDILIPFKDLFYVPCMIHGGRKEIETIKTEIMVEESCWKKTSWLCITFDFLPPSFFHHILSCFTKKEMFKDGIENLYCGTCVFNMRSIKSPEKLVVCVSKSKLAMQGWVCANNQDFTPGLYSYVRNQLENFVFCIKKRYALNIRYDVACIPFSCSFMSKDIFLKDLFENHFNFKAEKVNYGDKNFESSTFFEQWFTSWLTLEDNSLQKTKNICLKHSNEWKCKYKQFLQEVELVNISNFDAVCTCSDANNHDKEVWKTVSTEQMALAHFGYKNYFSSNKDQTVPKHQEFYSTLVENDMFFYDTKCSADRLVCVMFSKVVFGGIEEKIPKAKLAIDLPEYFQRTQKDKTECLEGNDVELTFVAVDHDFDAQWEKDCKPICQSSKYEIKHEGKSHTLIIRNCTLEDSGNYSIEVNYREISTSLHVKGKMREQRVNFSLDNIEKARQKYMETVNCFTTDQFQNREHSVMLNRLLGQGSYESYDMRIMVTGQFGVGKTSLVLILVGDALPNERRATDGIFLMEGRCGLGIEGKDWIVIKKEDYDALDVVYNKVLTSSLESDTKVKQTTTMQKQLSPNMSSETRPAINVTTSEGKLKHTEEMPRRNIMSKVTKDAIRKKMEAVLKSGKYKMKTGRIIFWDFGGQYVYYTTHQTFMTYRALFLVVFDGSKGLYEEVKDVMCFPGQQGTPTPAVFLQHWVNSILTYCKLMYPGIPKILFVATHKDKVDQSTFEKTRESLYADVEKLFKDHHGRQHLILEHQLFVNATDRNDEGIKDLKKVITDLTFDHPCWGEPMPNAWIPLELEIAEISAEGKQVLLYKDVEDLNNASNVSVLSKEDLKFFLGFQHSLGKIIYFDTPQLRDYVIIGPLFLIEVMKSFVTDERFWPDDRKMKLIFTKMSNEGVIKKSDLFMIWEQFEKIRPYKDFVLSMLVHLDILSEQRRYDLKTGSRQLVDEYFVPCMLTKQDRTKLMDRYMKNVCTPGRAINLAFVFKSTIIPPAIPNRLISACLSMWAVKAYDTEKLMFPGFVALSWDKSHDIVLSVLSNKILVYIIHESEKGLIVRDIATGVRECLHTTLERILEFYQSTTSSKKTDSELSFHVELACLELKCYQEKSALEKTKKQCVKHKKEYNVDIWYQSEDTCSINCRGLTPDALCEIPTDLHILRLSTKLTIDSVRELAIMVGLSIVEWDTLVFDFQKDGEMLKYNALIKSRNKRKLTFKCIQDILPKAGSNDHILCEVKRLKRKSNEIPEEYLNRMLTDEILDALAPAIASHYLFLGIELGLSVADVRTIEYDNNNNLCAINKCILQKWRTDTEVKPTLDVLERALVNIGRGYDCLKIIIDEIIKQNRNKKPVPHKSELSSNTSEATTMEVNPSHKSEHTKTTTMEVTISHRTEHTKPSNVASLIKFEQK